MDSSDRVSTGAAAHSHLGWGWRPNPLQELLVHASLGTGPGTVAAAERAFSLYPIADFDDGSRRLLPLVYRLLADVGWQGKEQTQLRAIHRRSWAGNHRLIVGLRSLVEESKAEFPLVALKGLPAALSLYPDIGSRPFADIDVLTTPEGAHSLSETLRRLGFVGDGKLEFGPTRRLSYNAINFGRISDGMQCDVHWRLSFEERRANEVERISRSIPLVADPVAGLELLRLDTTDTLFHVLVHAMRWNTLSPVRWIVDVSLLLRHEGHHVDWDRLRNDADRGRVLSCVRDGLDFVERGGFSADIPADVMREIRGSAVGQFDVLAQHVRTSPPSYLRSVLRLFVIDFMQRSANERPIHRALLYPLFVVRTLRRTRQFEMLRSRRRITAGS